MIWDWRWAKEPPMQGETEIVEKVSEIINRDPIVARAAVKAILEHIKAKCPEIWPVIESRINAR